MRHLIYFGCSLPLAAIAGVAARTPNHQPWLNPADLPPGSAIEMIGTGLVVGLAAYVLIWCIDVLTGGRD